MHIKDAGNPQEVENCRTYDIYEKTKKFFENYDGLENFRCLLYAQHVKENSPLHREI